MKEIVGALLLALSMSSASASGVKVHWPLMDYMGTMRTQAETHLAQSGGQMRMSFPMLLVYAVEGKLVWMGKPDTLDIKVLRTRADPASDLASVLASLDQARKTYADVGFDQVDGLPSEQIERDRPTAVLVVPNFSCEACAGMIEGASQQIPEDWNLVIAAVTLGQ